MTLLKKIYTSGFAWIWIAIAVIMIDRYSKLWVVENLTFQEPLTVLPFFNFTLSFNKGAAFSFLHTASGWQNWFLGGLALIVSILIVFWLAKLSARAYWISIALCLVLGGALGNAWDRVLYGYVIDFLSFHLGSWYFAIFNLADSAICVGAVMILLQWTWQGKSNPKR